MRYSWLISLLLLQAPVWAAEDAKPGVTADIYLLRTGEMLQSPHVVTYRMVEWTQTRGRWIAPDFGYYDTGYGRDQIWFAGAGARFLNRRHIDWSQEVYLTQEAGPESQNKRSLWLWPVVDLSFLQRLTGEIAAYPTIPLDKAQRWGADVDRAKLEWADSSRWLMGFGYSGGICTSRSWQSKPFVTVTRKTKNLGDVEFWLQPAPDGAQVQLRYLLVRDER